MPRAAIAIDRKNGVTLQALKREILKEIMHYNYDTGKKMIEIGLTIKWQYRRQYFSVF